MIAKNLTDQHKLITHIQYNYNVVRYFFQGFQK